jgi:hypothetical protein
MDIYGKLEEHPEVPIEDPARFTVQLKFHDFETQYERQLMSGRMRRVKSPFCAACGFNRITPVHPKES